MNDDPKPGMFSPLSGTGPGPAPGRAAARNAWHPVVPVPEGAPPPPDHFKRGAPSACHPYHGPDGRLWGYVCRFDLVDGGKEFLPQTFCRRGVVGVGAGAGDGEWRWKGFNVPRPLYGLDRLASRPGASVVVCEGEKATDAATALLPDWVAVTSPGGSNAAARADWVALTGRRAVIWPDADGPGLKYAATVAKALVGIGVGSVAIVVPPEGAADGWDAADAVAEKWDTQRTVALLEAARSAAEIPEAPPGAVGGSAADGSADGGNTKNGPAPGDGSGNTSGPPQRNNLIGLIEGAELWHSQKGGAYATIPVRGHVENWQIRARGFKIWLAGRYYEVCKTVPGGSALEDALRVIEARAIHQGPCHEVFIRLGKHAGAVYIDLGGDDWKAVKVTGEGWEIVEKVPIKFRRSSNALPLPVPERGGSIDLLRGVINYGTEENFMMAAAWLVGAFNPDGTYPVLVLGGEQGSAKSSQARALRRLTDPNVTPIRTIPTNGKDLFIDAYNARVLSYDNLPSLPPWLSDGLCCILSGTGFATRALYSNFEEATFAGRRLVILNGIGDLATKGDLASRALMVTLPAIPAAQRRTEREWERDFEEVAPEIFGAVLDGVASALRHRLETSGEGQQTSGDDLSRLADFEAWVKAASPGLGWDAADFMALYEANREDAIHASIEADTVAQAVLKLVDAEPWEGPAADLLPELEQHTSPAIIKSRAWPKTPSGLSRRLTQAAPILRKQGVQIERSKGGKDSRRLIFLRKSPIE